MKPISIPEPVRWVLPRKRCQNRVSMPSGIRYSADVTGAENADDKRQQVGLCFDCLHANVIQSPRGSTFYRCTLSDKDSSFPKYPRLPVLHCAGYSRKA